jgi:hypothetical protein
MSAKYLLRMSANNRLRMRANMSFCMYTNNTDTQRHPELMRLRRGNTSRTALHAQDAYTCCSALMRLRGGRRSKTERERYERFKKKFRMGMALFEAAGMRVCVCIICVCVCIVYTYMYE